MGKTFSLDKNQAIEMHKALVKLRGVEEYISKIYPQQEMRTPVHLGTGQEAVAVGVCSALTKNDAVYSHHRCHNHYLAMGGSVRALAAELYGRETGASRGRGGSVHLTDRQNGFVVSSAILGETIACAVGSSLAFAMDKSKNVAVSFFGDAACEEGILYESLNYAAIKNLPVIFVCENNLYSTESSLSVRQPAGTSLVERARAFKVEASLIDGNNVASVFEAASNAIDRARNGGGPSFLELNTYRWREHVGPHFDHDLGRTYRDPAELVQWMDQCPIKQSKANLIEKNYCTSVELEKFGEEIESQIASEFDQAKLDRFPDVETLFDNVF